MLQNFMLAFAWIYGVLSFIGIFFCESPEDGWNELSVLLAICSWAYIVAHYIR